MRIGIISTGFNGQIPNAENLDTPTLYEMCGYNTGNLAFWGGVSKSIDNDIEFIGWDFDPEKLKRELDLLVFPAANQIAEGNDLGYFADRLEKTNLPMIVVGLGAQASGIGDALQLSSGTRRWLDLISERSNSIGVRGTYSAEVLASLGIQNITISGCPSLFINEKINLGAILEDKYNSKIIRILAHQGEMAAHTIDFERALFNFCVRNGTRYVCQAPLTPIALDRKEFLDISSENFSDFRKYYAPEISDLDLIRHIKYNMVAFFDFEDWMNYSKNFDLSIGARLHGNFLAMQGETPAIIVTHDSRTLELAQTLLAPVLSTRDATSGLVNIYDTLEEIDFDGAAYDRNRSHLARNYIGMFESAGVTTKPYLYEIAQAH